MRILLLQLKRIGDTILTAPVLSSLRRQLPEAHLTFVVNHQSRDLAPLFSSADAVWAYRKRSLDFSLWAKLLPSSFDLCLDFTGNDRSAFMTVLSGAEQRVTYRKLADHWYGEMVYNRVGSGAVRDLHTVDYHLSLLEEVGLDSAPSPFAMEIPAEVLAAVEQKLRAHGVTPGRFALAHPGTARPEKYWRAQRWAALIDELAKRWNMPVVITGGPHREERRHIDAILQQTESSPIDLAGKLNLLESAACIQLSALALGVDTAAMHLANAFEIPQIVLFGPTNPYHWRPRHARAISVLGDRILGEFEPMHRHCSMDAISTDLVSHAIEQLYPPLSP